MAEDFEKIKRNVQKMIAVKAPEEDIDGYLQTEGLTPEQFKGRVAPGFKTGVSGIDTVMQPLKAFSNQATDWMMLGKQDEILAGLLSPIRSVVKGLPLGQSYADELTRLENERAGLQSESPIASNIGAVTGALTGPAATAGMKFINKGATMAGRAMRSMLPGAITGAVAGAEGDTLAQRGEGALWGLGISAGLAPVAQIGGEAIGAGLSKLFNFIRGAGKQTLPSVATGTIDDPLTASVMQQPQSSQVSTGDMNAAARDLWRRLELDGRDPAKVFAAIQSGQMDERSIASIAGPNVKQMIDTAATMPGRAKEIIGGAQLAQQQGQKSAVMKATEKGLGVSDDFVEFDDLLAAQKKAAGPLYKEAYASNQNISSPVVDRILKTPAGKKALREAADMMQNDMSLMGVPDAELNELMKDAIALGKMADPETGVGVSAGLKLRSLDYVKRALDDQYGVLARAGEKTKAGIILDLKRSLVKELDAADITARIGPNSTKPEGGAYARARKTFAGPASMKDALKIGRDIMKDDWIGNREIVAKMSESELKAFRIGARQSIKDFIGGARRTNDAAARIEQVDKYMDRLRPAFPTEEAFEQFRKSLVSQSLEFQSISMAGKGSQSLPRLADATGHLDTALGAAVDTTRAAGGDLTMIMRGIKGLTNRLSAPSEGQRAAASSLALTAGKNALPYLRAIQSRADPRMLGTALSGSVALPARELNLAFGPMRQNRRGLMRP